MQGVNKHNHADQERLNDQAFVGYSFCHSPLSCQAAKQAGLAAIARHPTIHKESSCIQPWTNHNPCSTRKLYVHAICVAVSGKHVARCMPRAGLAAPNKLPACCAALWEGQGNFLACMDSLDHWLLPDNPAGQEAQDGCLHRRWHMGDQLDDVPASQAAPVPAVQG